VVLGPRKKKGLRSPTSQAEARKKSPVKIEAERFQ
jgi:hypothetical protein